MREAGIKAAEAVRGESLLSSSPGDVTTEEVAVDVEDILQAGSTPAAAKQRPAAAARQQPVAARQRAPARRQQQPARTLSAVAIDPQVDWGNRRRVARREAVRRR